MTRRPTATAVLLVLVLGAGVLTGWLALDDPDTPRTSATVAGDAVLPTVKDGVYSLGSIPDPESRAALQAAVDAVPAALSYDYRSLDAALARATALMTEDFAAEYSEIFDKTTRGMATDKEAVTTTLVRGAGLSTAIEDDTVTCLVYLDQFLIASKGQQPSQSYTAARVHVLLQKVDGAWKVSGLEPF